MNKSKWRKYPSVTTGGAKFFFTGMVGGDRAWVLLDEDTRKWRIQWVKFVPGEGYFEMTVGQFGSPREAMEYVDSHHDISQEATVGRRV